MLMMIVTHSKTLSRSVTSRRMITHRKKSIVPMRIMMMVMVMRRMIRVQ